MSRGTRSVSCFLVVAWHCVIAYACQYVCSAWCLTCDLRLCLGRKLYKHLTKMRPFFALAIAMAILALYLQHTTDLEIGAQTLPSSIDSNEKPPLMVGILTSAYSSWHVRELVNGRPREHGCNDQKHGRMRNHMYWGQQRSGPPCPCEQPTS